jgi:hypothetical protein
MLEAALDATAALIEAAYAASNRSTLKFGPDADVAAFALMRLSLLHLQGVVDLGRAGEDRFVPACAAGRSAFETAALSLWLSEPEEAERRQRRWLHWVRSGRKYYSQAADYFEREMPDLAAQLRQGSEVMANWERVVAEQFDQAFQNQLLRFEAVLSDLKLSARYLIYRNLSQPAHGTPDGLRWVWRLREADGNEPSRGVWTGPDGEVTVAFHTYATIESWGTILGPSAYAVCDATISCVQPQGASQEELVKLSDARGDLNEALRTIIEAPK